MPEYVQSKITADGPKASYRFHDTDMDAAVQRVKDTIPGLRTFHNAVAIVLTSDDPGEDVVTLRRGTDF